MADIVSLAKVREERSAQVTAQHEEDAKSVAYESMVALMQSLSYYGVNMRDEKVRQNLATVQRLVEATVADATGDVDALADVIAVMRDVRKIAMAVDEEIARDPYQKDFP